MSESLKGRQTLPPAGTRSWSSDTEKLTKRGGISSEITLDLIVRTAFKLQKILPHEAEVNVESLHPLGQQAIELLSIWKRQLENEKRTGTAAKNAEELVIRWEMQREEERRSLEELEHKERQAAEWEKIPNTRRIPFAQAAKMIFPKKRGGIKWLERMLKILIEEKFSLNETVKVVCREALKDKSIPEGFIPQLKDARDSFLKGYKRWIAKQHGKKGGIRRAQKYSRNDTATKHDE
jgi:hypothetical protein